MAAQLLREDSRLTLVTKGDLRILQPAVEEACKNKHAAFFRIANRVVTFQEGIVHYRIDVDEANDNQARQKMGLANDAKILYAQLQTGSGQTIANIIYPQNAGSVQINTLITALQQSMEHRSIYTAIH